MRWIWLLAWPSLGLAQAPEPVELIFLDVGQGDAAVIRSPEGNVALVDGGPSFIVPLLQRLGIHSIDVVIATHPHVDHIGGLEAVINNFRVKVYMDNGVRHGSATYRNLMSTVSRSGIDYISVIAQTIPLGSVSLRVLPPPDVEESLNNRSVGLVVEHGEFRALLTGDAERPELNHFLTLNVPDVTVLKASHHGATNGVSPRWIQVTNPEVVVISVGTNNAFGHPRSLAMRYYHSRTDKIYRTDLDGEVRVLGRRDGSYEVTTGAGISTGRVTADAAQTEAAPPAEHAPGSLISLWVLADALGNDNNNLNGEYAVIRNESGQTISVARWTLCDAARHCFHFPAGSVIPPGDSAVVYTGTGVNSGGRFYLNRRQAIWNNRGDTATLWDAGGMVVTTYTY